MKNPTETVEFFIHVNDFKSAKIVLDLLKPYANNLLELDQIGKLYYEIKDFGTALEISFKIYNLVNDPHDKVNAISNIISTYIKLNKPHDALKYIKLSEEYDSNNLEIKLNKSLAHFFLNDKDEGEQILKEILRCSTDTEINNKVEFNLGIYDLKNGNFQQGLRRCLLVGKEFNSWNKMYYPKDQLWEGDNQPGKTIIVCAEGGIGDEFISIRFMRHLKNIGMDPIWQTDRKDLIKIFNRCGYKTISTLNSLPRDWLWTYSMSVPCYLNLTEDDLWYEPYLKSLNEAPLLCGKKKIGIKTTGNSNYDQDLHRTIPFNELINCIPNDYTIYSFHIEEDFEHPRVNSLKKYIKNWDDTLDYINQMDLIISSCTSLIHAAGAMGKDSIVIVPILTYYIWAKTEYKSKWYGNNLTVLRQLEHDNWDAPLTELKELLHEY